MCKHVLNAQVAIRTPCCRKWFDCPQCHAEHESHPLLKSSEITLMCKKCKRAFRKDMSCLQQQSSYEGADGSGGAEGETDESDEYCPHCDNRFVIEAKEPKMRIEVEGEDVRVDARMLRDQRLRSRSLERELEELAEGKLG